MAPLSDAGSFLTLGAPKDLSVFHASAMNRAVRAHARAVRYCQAMSRSCARPTCSIAAAATMSYDYDAQIVWIESLHIEGHPMTHDLCVTHADRSKPPQGWELRDERSPRGIYALHAS